MLQAEMEYPQFSGVFSLATLMGKLRLAPYVLQKLAQLL